MATIQTLYLGDLRTEITHVQSGNRVITDAPTDNNGKGEYISPADRANLKGMGRASFSRLRKGLRVRAKNRTPESSTSAANANAKNRFIRYLHENSARGFIFCLLDGTERKKVPGL